METGYPPQINGNHRGTRPVWLPTTPAQGPDENELLNFADVMAALKRRAWILVGTTLVGAAAAGFYAKANPVYRSAFQMLIKPTTVETKLITSLPQSLDGNKSGSAEATTKGLDDTKLKLLVTEKAMQPAVNKLQAKYPGLEYWQLHKGLEIKPVPNTDILAVAFSDKDPQKVKDVLFALGEGYRDYSLDDRRSEVQQGVKFIDAQLPELQAKVSQLQNRMQAFRQQNQFFDPESQSKEIGDQVSTFRKQLLDNQVLLDQAKARFGELQAQNFSGLGEGKTALALTESSRYQKLLEQINLIDNQLAEKRSIYQDDHEEVKILVDQRAKVVPLLESEANRVQGEAVSKVRDLEARNASLQQKDDALSVRTRNLSQQARQYTDIQRELQIATENLNQFLAKQSTLKIDAGQQLPPWQVISPAAAPQPGSLPMNLILGGLGGLTLGALLALLIDRMNNVYYSTEELKKACRLPVLGSIPHNKEIGTAQPANLAQVAFSVGKVRRFGNLPFLESLRSLQTNLRLLNADQPVRSIAISSATPQDGKSTIAAYLAQVASAMGQRILLVDAEMRRPQLHNRLNLQNTRGLSDLLVSNADSSEYIQKSPLGDNLFVLTAGQLPPDPVSLLSSVRMQQLMEQFEAQFDLVIYDTPPLGGFSDAHLVASKTDGLLLVARIEGTDRDGLERVLEGLRMLPTKVLGIVANDSRQSHNHGIYSAYYNAPPVPSQQPTLAKRP
jgi:polysaccharide biosynthesis transport protein